MDQGCSFTCEGGRVSRGVSRVREDECECKIMYNVRVSRLEFHV